MKLFTVFYLAGKIIIVGGPVDGPEEECRQAARQAVAELADVLVRSGYTVDDVRADCEWHNKKPPTYDEPRPDFLDLERLDGRVSAAVGAAVSAMTGAEENPA